MSSKVGYISSQTTNHCVCYMGVHKSVCVWRQNKHRSHCSQIDHPLLVKKRKIAGGSYKSDPVCAYVCARVCVCALRKGAKLEEDGIGKVIISIIHQNIQTLPTE